MSAVLVRLQLEAERDELMEKLKKMEADMSSERGTTLEEQAQPPAS